MNIQEFINLSQIKHNDLYDYSLTKYKDTNTKVEIICPIHGSFFIRPRSHLKGTGCGLCSGYIITTDIFVKKAIIIHGYKYDYSKSNYIGNKKKLTIICKQHGEFEQIPNSHLLNRGCPNCAIQDTQSFIQKAILKHGDVYDYSLVNYDIKKVLIKCNKHGVFKQTPNNHLQGAGCPQCKTSKGETKIINWLLLHDINYIHQYKFNDCKNQRNLVFDFYFPELNLALEYNGIQHYKPVSFGSKENPQEKFSRYTLSDTIKKEYCENNQIHLCVISYEDFENIELILKGIFNEQKQ